MENIAADCDDEAADLALGAADGQRIQQRLRRMFMGAVAGIDNRAGNLLRQKRYRTGLVVADDQDIGPHGIQCHCRIDQRFALFDAGVGHGHVHHVSTGALACQFEGGLRAGRCLKEQIYLCQSPQCRGFLLALPGNLDGFIRPVEQIENIGLGQALDAEKMTVRKGHRQHFLVQGPGNGPPIGMLTGCGKPDRQRAFICPHQ